MNQTVKALLEGREDNHILPYFAKGVAWYRPSVENELGNLDAEAKDYLQTIVDQWEQ